MYWASSIASWSSSMAKKLKGVWLLQTVRVWFCTVAWKIPIICIFSFNDVLSTLRLHVAAKNTGAHSRSDNRRISQRLHAIIWTVLRSCHEMSQLHLINLIEGVRHQTIVTSYNWRRFGFSRPEKRRRNGATAELCRLIFFQKNYDVGGLIHASLVIG